MRIYRFEHNREICKALYFVSNGASPTGHGPFNGGCYYVAAPNFGGQGPMPITRVQQHERCAVMAIQFPDWVHPSIKPQPLTVPSEWDLMCYDLKENDESVHWRFDAQQIIFDPIYAVSMGVVAQSNYKDLLARRDVLV